MNLHDYDLIVVNSSGGKDSQTALRQVWLLAREQDFPSERIIVSHQDLKRMEWEGTKDLARGQAELYGFKFKVSGRNEELLDYVRRRGKWPDNRNRYCTSDFKRTPGQKVISAYAYMHRIPGRPFRVLQVFGFRAEESPARKKKPVLARNKRWNSRVQVTDWLPIHEWTEDEVWADIKASGVPYHPAYDIGMPRLSCSFCIFAPRGALIIAGRARPKLLEEYVAVERDIGHTFRQKQSLADIKAAIERGEQPANLKVAWNM